MTGCSNTGGAPIPPSQDSKWRDAFLQRHALTAEYLPTAQKWFDPLVQRLIMHHDGAKPTRVLGLNGSQGSGKSTLADYLASALSEEHGLPVLNLSLDDFYLTREQRHDLAITVHPLLATRGVPGTHDLPLLLATLERLADPGAYPVAIPRFDKARDDRRPLSDWDSQVRPPALVILEGWCLGATPQAPEALVEPVNELEATEDQDGRWRQYVNRALAEQYPGLHQRVDEWVMLCAPSFDCVLAWRTEQERKLARRDPDGVALMNEAQVRRFVQHYQRLTEHCIGTLPGRVHHLYRLDRQRQITGYEQPLRGAKR